MIGYNLKITLRSLLRHKSFSFINIAGLSLGLITVLAIGFYVADEFSYDQFHAKKDRIYRVNIQANFDGSARRWGRVPNKLARTAAAEIPEVEKAVRVFHHNFGDIAFLSTDKEKFAERELYFADPEIFDVFSITLLEGDARTALSRKGTVMLSETAARKYFGNGSPLGKSLLVDNRVALEVTAVYRDFPAASSLPCQLIGSFSSIRFGEDSNQNWGNASFETFLLLRENVQMETVNQKLGTMLERNIPKDDRWFSVFLQPLVDIHLHSEALESSFDRQAYGDMNQLRILIALAIAVLVIAAVNYMNLTTAQSQRRNKEVGVSKTLGASFGQLNRRFFLEAATVVFISVVVSVALFLLLLPLFNQLTGKVISMEYVQHPIFWGGLLVVWVALTLLAGFYPAFYLSSFSPKSVMQKTVASKGQGLVRKGLVVFQFTISIALIICTTLFFQQMKFIGNKKLGFDPEQVVAVVTSGIKDPQLTSALKKEFESLAEVKLVSESRSYPGIGSSGYTITPEGSAGRGGTMILNTRASHEIIDVLGLHLLAGRTLPAQKDPKDTTIQVVLNKSAIDYLGWTPEQAIGRRVSIFNDMPTDVVGVVDDFHFASLHQKIGPYCFSNCPWDNMQYLLVRVEASDIKSVISKLESTFKKIAPVAFEYSFLDDEMTKLYEADQRLTYVITFFSGLAIFIACLGLYSLTSYTAEQKTKEIGIRKVLGASVTQLVTMFSREFMILVLVAFVVGIPVSYYFIQQWLQGFAYRVTVGPGVFLLSGAIGMLVAWITVSIESFKAARANPVKGLRSE